MRRNLFAILFAFLLVMMVVAVMTTGVIVAGVTAYPTAASGQVELSRNGKQPWRTFEYGSESRDRVKVGDMLRTGADGRLALQWADGTRLELGPNTTLTVTKYTFDLERAEEAEQAPRRQTSLFRLDLGKVWVRISHELRGDSRFEIQTPTAVAGVRGTIFSVAATPDSTEIQVFEGTVAVTGAGRSDSLAAGQVSVVAADSVQTRPLNAEEVRAWSGQDAVLPDVTVRRFLPGRVGPDGRYELRGTAEPGATVTIDGQPATVDNEGSFCAEVTVQPGTNQYAIEVTDTAGQQRRTEHVIDYRPRDSDDR